MVGRSEHGMMLEGQMRLNQRIMKRNLSRCGLRGGCLHNDPDARSQGIVPLQ